MIEVAGSMPLSAEEEFLVNEMAGKVRYQAQRIFIKYDEEDLGYYKLSDGHIVVLVRSVYLPILVCDEDSGPPSYMVEYEYQKTPNVYLVYPDQPPVQPTIPGAFSFSYWLPEVHARIPQLVALATPDGKVRFGDHAGMVDHIVHKEMDKRVKGILSGISEHIERLEDDSN